MKRLRAIFILLCLPTAGTTAEEEPRGLEALLCALGNERRVEAAFTEQRHNPVRRVPTRFSGILRHDRSHGLSLAYESPRESVILIRGDGVWRKRPGRTPEALPASGESDFLSTALPAIFAFDLPRWEESFNVSFETQDEGSWTIDLAPRPDVPSDNLLRSIELYGEGLDLRRIHIRRPNRSRIEIHIEATRYPESWEAATMREAFFTEEPE
ncbi:MAG: hypothetical protein JJU00_07795 [Opitutales bacterium]|nr:hypothetical protein [Opitutales bacterium]